MRAKTKQDQQPAQIGGGDPRVVAHPGFRKIPDCLFPLRTKEAKREYNTLARVLFDAGHMTVAKHRALSSYACSSTTSPLPRLRARRFGDRGSRKWTRLETA